MILDIFLCKRKKKSQEVHSTEPEFNSICISNIIMHIDIYHIRVYPRKGLISNSSSTPPPRLFQPPDYCYIEPFPTPPIILTPPPFIRYSRVRRHKVIWPTPRTALTIFKYNLNTKENYSEQEKITGIRSKN